MTRRLGITVLVIAVAAPFLAGQAPKRIGVAPREKPRLSASITVIDLRDVASDKKPPKREPGQVLLPRMMMPGSSPNRPLSGLPPGQLSEALQSAGIGPMATNVYARFTPGQSNLGGKGYLFLAFPAFVFPDHAEFQSGPRDQYDGNLGGPRVVLRGPGTYTIDFLVEFTAAPPQAFVICQSVVGTAVRQVKTLRAAGGPQHIVLVYPLSQEAAGAPDEDRSIGIHCFQEAGVQKTPWTLYLVDVTKN